MKIEAVQDAVLSNAEVLKHFQTEWVKHSSALAAYEAEERAKSEAKAAAEAEAEAKRQNQARSLVKSKSSDQVNTTDKTDTRNKTKNDKLKDAAKANDTTKAKDNNEKRGKDKDKPRERVKEKDNYEHMHDSLMAYFDAGQAANAFPRYDQYPAGVIRSLLLKLKKFKLTKAEAIMILNLKPRDTILLDVLVEELDDRISTEDQEELLEIINQHLSSEEDTEADLADGDAMETEDTATAAPT